ncbi:MAG: stage III sporulation protein AA [Thermaerobacterales bacterium]
MERTLAGVWHQEIIPHLAQPLRQIMASVPDELLSRATELRLRAAGPLQVILVKGDIFISEEGRSVPDPRLAWRVPPQVLIDSWQILCRGSVYAWEEETRQGFLTLGGGHRVGLAGRFLAEGGRVLRLRQIGSLAVRLSRQVTGCADAVLPALMDEELRTIHHSLLYSPPGAGKTTLLRDLVRQISEGRPRLQLPGRRVTVIDERCELAACRDGYSQYDLGPRTDVLDACPKADGILMALRSLNPEVIAFDEISQAGEVRAVLEAAYAGVRVITTAHARVLSDLQERPALELLFAGRAFQRFVRLERRNRPGFIVSVEGLNQPRGRIQRWGGTTWSKPV